MRNTDSVTTSIVTNYGRDEAYDARQRKCLDCNNTLSSDDIANDYELCVSCADMRWNNKQWGNECKALAKEQANDLSKPQLHWWNETKPVTQQQWQTLARNKGYSA